MSTYVGKVDYWSAPDDGFRCEHWAIYDETGMIARVYPSNNESMEQAEIRAKRYANVTKICEAVENLLALKDIGKEDV